MKTGTRKGYKVSLRYKLALPVWVFVFLILVLLTHTSIRLIRSFVLDSFQERVLTETETFAENINPTFLRRDFKALRSHVDWFMKGGKALGVRIEDREGMVILRGRSEFPFAEPSLMHERLWGVRMLADGAYMVTVPLGLEAQERGRLRIFFSAKDVDLMVRSIYRERIFISFVAGLAIAVITAAWTWITIRPLFRLRSTVQQILKGETGARAQIHTGDEIEELAEGFNEMVGRLQQSLRNLRSRSEALEESEEKYRVLVENASDVIWLLSPGAQIVFLSQGFAGFQRSELLSEGLELFLSFHSGDSAEKFQTALDQVRQQKTPVLHLATVYRHPKTGAEVFYSTNLTPVLTRGGGLKAIQAVSRDVTELKRIEMMKDRLIRDVAHELKTPVAKFQMTLKWLEKEMAPKGREADYHDVVELMKRNADLLMSIITEVMDLSRLESGAEAFDRKPCDLNQILKRVCDDLEPIVKEKKLRLERGLAGSPLEVQGDEKMLYRLFSNLVVNAVKFTSEGKIVVESRAVDGACLARIRDTGIGLEKEDMEKVFDRFYQKSPATTGMGLGLALAREIVHLHGGRIWAESEGPGKGSAFVVEFQK